MHENWVDDTGDLQMRPSIRDNNALRVSRDPRSLMEQGKAQFGQKLGGGRWKIWISAGLSYARASAQLFCVTSELLP